MVEYQTSNDDSSIFNIILNSVKLDLWMQHGFAHNHLKKIVLLIMDEIIIKEGNKADLPMELISIYESLEHDFKAYLPLRKRIKCYTYYIGKLYRYICLYLKKSKAVSIVKEARRKALFEEREYVKRRAKGNLPGMSGQGKRLRREIGLI